MKYSPNQIIRAQKTCGKSPPRKPLNKDLRNKRLESPPPYMLVIQGTHKNRGLGHSTNRRINKKLKLSSNEWK